MLAKHDFFGFQKKKIHLNYTPKLAVPVHGNNNTQTAKNELTLF